MIDGERGVMEPGTCCYINANLTHRVSNRGDCDRIHLVVDCAVDDWLRWFDRAEIFYFVLRRDPREARQMIELLRAMGTTTAQAIFAKIEEELSGVEGQGAV